MPNDAEPVYRRGKYSLDWDRRRDGSLRSPFLTIFWYDSAKGRVRSASTGTADEDSAMLALDRRWLADRGEAPAFCPTCGRPHALGKAYLLTDAIADYRLEHGDAQISGATIKTRLDRVLAFLDSEEARGDGAGGEGVTAIRRFGLDTSCADACTRAFVLAFRAWSRTQPVVWRNKAGAVTRARPRTPAAVEAEVAQLVAVLNHAVNAEPSRSDVRPAYRPLPGSQVQRKRRSRATLEEIAAMLRYASAPRRDRAALHAFIVASICTLARTEAVCQISVDPARGQWAPGLATLDLNPAGRVQNRKRRAVVPVVPLLEEWLVAARARFDALPEGERTGAGWLVATASGRGVANVDTAWKTMLKALGLPTGKEWQSYILRHSLATLIRNRGSGRWDTEGALGHRAPSTTEIYAIGEFPSVAKALNAILADLERLAPGALHRSVTGTTCEPASSKERKMPG